MEFPSELNASQRGSRRDSVIGSSRKASAGPEHPGTALKCLTPVSARAPEDVSGYASCLTPPNSPLSILTA
jgi:hypothetical protein